MIQCPLTVRPRLKATKFRDNNSIAVTEGTAAISRHMFIFCMSLLSIS